MKNTWILLADAHRARCLQRQSPDYALTELADFVHPQTRLSDQSNASDISGDAGKGHGRTAHGGTQFEPHTEAQHKARAEFARTLADYLNQGVAEHRCNELVLAASSPMLGELRHALSPAALALVQHSAAVDLTHFEGPQLKQHVDKLFELPAA